MNIAANVHIDHSHASVRPIKSIGFLLVEGFTLIAMSAAIEPFRLANKLSRRTLYTWHTLTLDGKPVRASNGLQVSPDAAATNSPPADAIFVCGGHDIANRCSAHLSAWLQAVSAEGSCLGGVCSGAWVLAKAGLLDGYDCCIDSTYWVKAREHFPCVVLNPFLFVIDRDRFTAVGGTASAEMMLKLISDQHGRELVTQICESLTIEIKSAELSCHRLPHKYILGSSHPKLSGVVSLMETNLREPLGLDDLAGYMNVSRRQLERIFLKYLHTAPSRYYQQLRLAAARKLLINTEKSIKDIGLECGFISIPHFTKCYREHYGHPPRAERHQYTEAREFS